MNTTTEKEFTGYPSIDKPWLKYYPENAVDHMTEKANISAYKYILNANRDNLDSYALEYFGNKITYREMFENIHRVAQSLKSCGV